MATVVGASESDIPLSMHRLTLSSSHLPPPSLPPSPTITITTYPAASPPACPPSPLTVPACALPYTCEPLPHTAYSQLPR